MNSANKPVVCVVGLGSMGFGAAISLLRAGMTVRGVDIRPEVLARFAEAGGVPAKTPGGGRRRSGRAVQLCGEWRANRSGAV